MAVKEKKSKRVKRVAVSAGEAQMFKDAKKSIPNMERKVIYSFFPCDRHDCDCQAIVMDLKQKFAQMNPQQIGSAKAKMEYVRCPRDKSGMTKYKIYCNNCDALVGECFATDESLKDYCDFHYICSHDGEYWEGALGINISPVDLQIGIECACGEDTRDFRANTTLPDSLRKHKIEENSKGREFNQKNSKYRLVAVN